MATFRTTLASAVLGASFLLGTLAAPGVAFAAAKADAGKMTATLQALAAALKAGDKAKVVALYADDATIEDPVGSPPKAGREAIDKFYANAVDKKIFLDIVKVEELPDRTANVDVAVHVGERVVPSKEVYTFKPDGKIASMKAMPQLKKE